MQDLFSIRLSDRTPGASNRPARRRLRKGGLNPYGLFQKETISTCGFGGTVPGPDERWIGGFQPAEDALTRAKEDFRERRPYTLIRNIG